PCHRPSGLGGAQVSEGTGRGHEPGCREALTQPRATARAYSSTRVGRPLVFDPAFRVLPARQRVRPCTGSYCATKSEIVPVTMLPHGTNPAFCSVNRDAALSTLHRAAGTLPPS